MSSKPHRDPALISEAPLDAERDDEAFAALEALSSTLAAQLESANAELAALKGKKTVDDVRAEMLAEFSTNTFLFVVFYCISVGLILLLAGWKETTKFQLSDTILSIIAGSTAVSVIGLIGMVVSGLFGRPHKVAATKKAKTKSKNKPTK
ncbi:hypothetical protein ACQR50_10275 [Sphingomonas sp. Xoc002]|uniref:hypothetical protein n=1 Tax=Sphingomonas sp. Xoc002 TaxID=2837624 RepID=UPI003D182F99